MRSNRTRCSLPYLSNPSNVSSIQNEDNTRIVACLSDCSNPSCTEGRRNQPAGSHAYRKQKCLRQFNRLPDSQSHLRRHAYPFKNVTDSRAYILVDELRPNLSCVPRLLLYARRTLTDDKHPVDELIKGIPSDSNQRSKARVWRDNSGIKR